MKKILACFLTCAFLCAGLSGCGNKSAKMIEEAKNATLSQEISVNPAQNDYGAAAYKYLQYIQANYPGRIAGSEKETEMAVFLLSVLLNGGYEESDIVVNSFEIGNSSPVQDDSIENAFDGGEQSGSSQNIEVTKKGESDKIIIVGAHYDSAGTHGVDDNGQAYLSFWKMPCEWLMNRLPIQFAMYFLVQKRSGCSARGHMLKTFLKKKRKTSY